MRHKYRCTTGLPSCQPPPTHRQQGHLIRPSCVATPPTTPTFRHPGLHLARRPHGRALATMCNVHHRPHTASGHRPQLLGHNDRSRHPARADCQPRMQVWAVLLLALPPTGARQICPTAPHYPASPAPVKRHSSERIRSTPLIRPPAAPGTGCAPNSPATSAAGLRPPADGSPLAPSGFPLQQARQAHARQAATVKTMPSSAPLDSAYHHGRSATK